MTSLFLLFYHAFAHVFFQKKRRRWTRNKKSLRRRFPLNTVPVFALFTLTYYVSLSLFTHTNSARSKLRTKRSSTLPQKNSRSLQLKWIRCINFNNRLLRSKNLSISFVLCGYPLFRSRKSIKLSRRR